MKTKLTALLCAAVCSAFLSTTPAAHAQSAPAAAHTLRVADFFDCCRQGAVLEAALAPDGQRLAWLTPATSGRVGLVVMDLNSRERKMIKLYKDADITNLHWAGSKRLLYSLADFSVEGSKQHFNPGLLAIDPNGENERNLVSNKALIGGVTQAGNFIEFGEASNIKNRVHDAFSSLADVIPNSEDVYLIRQTYNRIDKFKQYNLLRANSRTMSTREIHRPGSHIDVWLQDQQGELRLMLGNQGGQRIMYYLPPGSESWKEVMRMDVVKNPLTPLGFDAAGQLYVSHTAEGGHARVHRFDLQQGKLVEPALIALKDNDFYGSLVFVQGKLAGARFETDGRDSIWLDEKLKAAQKKIDAKLGDTNNMLYPAPQGSRHLLVRASADMTPPIWFTYDMEADKLDLVGSSKPGINPKQMAQKDFVRYTARDGMSIPMYITTPRGAQPKNLPLVLLVHGGPNVRGVHWEWEATSQFLASRGYMVAEPLFRGSDGFGEKHKSAGYRQWGLKMQDDLVDAVQYMVKNGMTDPKRVCIAGASYGGYATMMGLIRDPELFQCGVNWVGVSDINLMFDQRYGDMRDISLQYWVPIAIGDPQTDADKLKANSPLYQADKLKKPLLMAYGGKDRRVPREHGRKMHDAVKAHNPQVEWVEYEDEGHGWFKLENNIDFWTRVENFLGKHIGGKK
ncbi:prolyl oligopeptidase family serine peptidase [Massilia sp. W12]|uniref:alpha/beta hydrolase family protein n=1 Tax=Massilia sp. W12 TaxID=3126507 RepID=UPI0030CA7362